MRIKLTCSLVVWLTPCLLVSLPPCLRVSHADFDEVIDSPMYKNPDLPVARVVTIFPEGAKNLWLRALERPEADLRCKAADALALGNRRGMKGLETTIAPLRAALDREQHPAVRLAVAQALIALEARAAAPSLFKQAKSGDSDLREVAEPALARWDYRPARAMWLERMREPGTRQRSLVLAIQGLATVGEVQATDRLREIVLSERVPGPIRLEAARALAVLRNDGLEKDAERLSTDTPPLSPPSKGGDRGGVVDRLCAASLLHQHRSAEAISLLQRLLRDDEPAVAALAVARLIEIDPELVVPALEHLLASPDAKVRSFGVEVLFRRPTEKNIRLLGDRLDDSHPEVRVHARRSLHELATKNEFRHQVIAQGDRWLATQQWRGLEQAAILLTQLDHKPVAGRLVELLRFNRPEVFITAAWGLRRLAVPETLPGVLSYAQGELKRPVHKDISNDITDHQFSQLNQFLGQQKYAPADALLRQFIPRMAPLGPESRAAAVWALGVLHEGKTIAVLATALEARLNDVSHPAPPPPEDFRVRWMSAITLGRLKAKEALPSLRSYCPVQEASPGHVHNACGWAIAQVTGEAMPPPKTIEKMQVDWFLAPRQ